MHCIVYIVCTIHYVMHSVFQARLEGSDISNAAAALVIAKLVTRPDLYKQYLRSTIEDILDRCKAAEQDPFFVGTFMNY